MTATSSADPRLTAASLSVYWHPIAASEDITEQPTRFQLLDDDLVAFRDEQGVAVFRDLCIHRGAALSLGWIRDGKITCPYHGWQYDRAGACVRIPSRPAGTAIPATARAQVYRAVERYGLVWVAVGDPVTDVPSVPDDAFDAAGWRSFRSYRRVWATSAARAVENFMDFSHFPYVHPGLLGTEDNAEIAPYDVTTTDDGLFYVFEQEEPSELYGQGGTQRVRYEYTIVLPFTIHLRKVETGSGNVTIITQFTNPRASKSSELFVYIMRNHSPHEPDSKFGDFTNTIMEQDRVVVESQRPEELPISLREELHIKVPDKASLLFRQRLNAITKVEVFGPYGA
jgi:phenylpropionate dioxygenase-like ring-hydroxylating dioxygenase large terminal subunit